MKMSEYFNQPDFNPDVLNTAMAKSYSETCIKRTPY